MFETGYKTMFSHVKAPKETYMRVISMAEERGAAKKRRLSRTVLVVAILVSAMILVGAYSGFVLYERPQEMLGALMGINGRSRYESENIEILFQSGDKQWIQTPGGTRTELDMELAEKWIAPYIYQVGERIVDGDTVVTAEACLVDRITHTAALYLKIENSPRYTANNRGQVWWLNENDEFYNYLRAELIGQDLFLSSFVIAEEMTTEDTLAVVLMFTCDESSEGMILSAGDLESSIMIHFPKETGMKYVELADGEIILSPFGARVNTEYFGIRFWTNDVISIKYKNGDEYMLQWEDPDWKVYEEKPEAGKRYYGREQLDAWDNLQEPIYNFNFSVFLDEENTSAVYIFNRVLDLDEVISVVINGIEYMPQ